MSVNVLRFNPVLGLRIVAWAPGITAPLESVIIPKTVASCVCGDAGAENKTDSVTENINDLYRLHFVFAKTSSVIPPKYLDAISKDTSPLPV